MNFIFNPKRKGKSGDSVGGNGDPTKRSRSKSTISRNETEEKAIQIVMLYEKLQGRESRDVRHGSGYDVESSERKIEVKSFKDAVGLVEIYQSEFDAAERHRDNFYLYIVSRLIKGKTPTIQIIRDPYGSIIFYAEKREVRNWKESVEETATFTV